MDFGSFENIVSCRVCYEIFDESSRCPRILNCGHSFCHSCIKTLLSMRSYCPVCKNAIEFSNVKLVPINFVAKSLISTLSVREGVRFKICAVPDTPVVEKSIISQRREQICRRSLISRRRDLICRRSLISRKDSTHGKRKVTEPILALPKRSKVTDHKVETYKSSNCQCSALLEEDYTRKKQQVCQEIEEELKINKENSDKISKSLSVLNIESNNLIIEINNREAKLQLRGKRINELEINQSETGKIDALLNRLQTLVESAVSDKEVLKAQNLLYSFLYLGVMHTSNNLQMNNFQLSFQTMVNLCKSDPVYVVENRNLYGKVTAKDDKIWISSFKNEKPKAKIIPFKILLSCLRGSTNFPTTTFLQLTPVRESARDIKIVIDTINLSSRKSNFSQLCAGLNGRSYKGKTLSYSPSSYDLNHPLGAAEEINNYINCVEGDVIGLGKRKCYFRIVQTPSKCQPGSQIGRVTSGLENLKNSHANLLVRDCGLVI